MGFKALKKDDMIPLLILDTTGFCDLKCVMCPQSRADEDPNYTRGIMDFGLYKNIIDEITSGRQMVNALLPFWNGEGTTHPRFTEMVEYAAYRNKICKGFNVFSMHTNFNSATREMIEIIIDSQIFGPITLSLDAITKNTYDKIRQGGDFNRLMENIHYFLEYREKKGYTYPSLIFQFIVMDDNLHETQPFYDHWSKTLCDLKRDFLKGYDDTLFMDRDTIFFRRCNVDTNEEQVRHEQMHKTVLEQLHFIEKADERRIIESDEYRVDRSEDVHVLTHERQPVRRPCVGLFMHFGVRWDGETSACCTDFKTEMSLGNVKEHGLWNIWTGEKLRQIRLWHIEGKFYKVPVCAPCVNQAFHSISDEDIKEYLLDIGSIETYNEYYKRMHQEEQ